MGASIVSAAWFRQFALVATLLALCVVSLGAYVRLSDAGLGCPDWPGCYGTMSVPESEAAIRQAQEAFPHSAFDHGKAWKEMLHRYLAGTLGILVLALFVLAWRARNLIRVSAWTPTVLLGLIVFQAMLGMWTVTMLLKPAVVTAHLLGGMATLAMLTWIAHRHWGAASPRFAQSRGLRVWIRGAVLVVFAQILLGGWTSTNYAALACTDFPTCHGAWFPEMDFANAFHWIRELGESIDGTPLELAALTAIQWTHRLGALVVLIYMGVLGWRLMQVEPMRKLGLVLWLLLVVQIALGIGNLLLRLPLVLAVGHNLVAALLVIAIIVLNSRITELPK
ncbi:cytochrome c oxidase assembly protein subunit 15 [Methylophilaceae bacterium]|nr:cytochrome c oxidase assembly protein subunit 15 [Methylophilaceae bacterium]